ncbi:adrenocorticotropic hormone receptor-like [Lineus longissimus]|uniref:adrenocorticotropic hormone receptor-like n=1 Tax=Lineus longissimus TaxID=88925 RepID=UPI00315C7F87
MTTGGGFLFNLELELSEEDRAWLAALRNRSKIKIESTNETMFGNWLDNLNGDPVDEDLNWEHFKKPPIIIAIILSTLAIAINILSIVVIYNVRGHLSAILRLTVSLIMSDMMVCICILTKLMTENYYSGDNSKCAEPLIRAFRMSSHVISLMNLLGMTSDLHLAIHRPLQYHSYFSKRKVNIMIVLFWIFSFTVGFSDFYIPSEMWITCQGSELKTYCQRVTCSKYDAEYALFVIIFIVVLILSVLYVRIYIVIRKQQYGNEAGRAPQYVRRNRKGLITTVLILATTLICFLPYVLLELILTIQIRINHLAIFRHIPNMLKADSYLFDLMLFNSLLDPIIYAARMRDVQEGYRRLFRINSGERRQQYSFSRSGTVVVERTVATALQTMSMRRGTEEDGDKEVLTPNNCNHGDHVDIQINNHNSLVVTRTPPGSPHRTSEEESPDFDDYRLVREDKDKHLYM